MLGSQSDLLEAVELAAEARLLDEDPIDGRFRFVRALVRDSLKSTTGGRLLLVSDQRAIRC